jgi:CubicO group peptidase (beta-lactamase class C family)
MRLFGLMTFALAMVFPNSGFALNEEGAAAAPERSVSGLADGLVLQAMAQHDTPGAVIAVIGPDGLTHSRGFGIARAAPEETPVTTKTLFRLGSVSKMFVYIATMQLKEEGRLGLDDPVNAHLPEGLQIPDEGFPDQPILVRHLMSHMAGFEDTPLKGISLHPSSLEPLAVGLAAHRPRRVRAPGRLPSYSNYSVALLAAAVQHVSGLPFEDYAESRIFRPLGMTTASFRQPYPADVAEEKGLPYPLEPNNAVLSTQPIAGAPGRWREGVPFYHSHNWPSGGLRASADDMAVFARALLDPGRLEAAGVLRRATFEEMLAPLVQLPGEPSPAPLHGFFKIRFGNELFGFGHGGALLSSEAFLVVVPDLQIAVFIAAHGPRRPVWVRHIPARLIGELRGIVEPRPVRNQDGAALAKSAEGAWLITRRPETNTLGTLFRFFQTVKVVAHDDGDITFGPVLGASNRYAPVGGGYWRNFASGDDRFSGTGRDVETLLFAGTGLVAFERVAPWRSFAWLAPAFLAAALIGVFAAISLARRLALRPAAAPGTLWASGLTDAAAIAWAVGLSGVVLYALQLTSSDAAAFAYPGILPLFMGVITVACVLSVAAAGVLADTLLRRSANGWGWWRTSKQIAAVVVLVAVSALAATNGWLGFSQ